VDNGHPFGDPKLESVPVLALWLIAYGIPVIWNRPKKPTDNAKVERMQGTSSRWVEPDKCSSLSELQKRLDKVAIQQRNYPTRVLKGKTREEYFPQLNLKRRAFDANDFDIDRVYQTLAKANFVRKVSKDGRIALFGSSYQIGRKYARAKVSIIFSLEKKQWIAKDNTGKALKEFEADTITKQNILSLSLCQ
jgi:transposase InsO family protein